MNWFNRKIRPKKSVVVDDGIAKMMGETMAFVAAHNTVAWLIKHPKTLNKMLKQNKNQHRILFIGKGTLKEPIVILNASSHSEGVIAEYKYIERLHGKEWEKVEQSVISNEKRILDEVKIRLKNKKEITYYFDISNFPKP